jgi:hypothetical protein
MMANSIRARPGELMKNSGTLLKDYSHYTVGHLIDTYKAGPERLRRVLEGLSEPELRQRPRGQDTWSAQEIAMHLVDSELQGVFRIRKAWSEPGKALPSYNQDIWTRELDHQGITSGYRESSLRLFALLRSLTVPIFENAHRTDWTARYGMHPDLGPLNLRELLEIYSDHSERHIQQVLEIRRLMRKPIELSVMLPYQLL